VLAHAHAAGLFEVAPKRSLEASGTVSGFAAARAMVALADGGMAAIWQELTYPPVPLDWTLARGQPVNGTLDLDTRRLNVELTTPDSASIAEAFPHREVTLALVQQTSAERARLALHPRFALEITRPDVSPNPLDRVDALLSEGDVVAVRVVHLAGGRLHLVLNDVDDDEPVLPALALVAGGPPWLREDRPLVSEPDAADASLTAIPIAAESSPAVALDERAAMPVEAEAPAGVAAAPVPASAPRPLPGPGVRRAETAPVPVPLPDRAQDSVAAAASAPTTAPTAPTAPSPSPTPPTTAPMTQPRALVGQLELTITQLKRENASLLERLRDAGAGDGALPRLRIELQAMHRQAQDALAELGEVRREVQAQKEELRDQRRQLRESRRKVVPVASALTMLQRRERWLEPDEWVRHETYLARVDRVAPTDRVARRLPADYAVGPRFAESLLALDDRAFAKAMRAVVDVLTMSWSELSSREVHALRSGDGGTAADVTRHDGARCFRAYIEQNTPQARRLHYWQLPGGTIELSRVVLHDDVEP
jgi:hypothetical protein